MSDGAPGGVALDVGADAISAAGSIAAAVIALAALVVAIYAAVVSRRAASSAEKQAEIAQKTYDLTSTPVISIDFEMLDIGDWHGFKFYVRRVGGPTIMYFDFEYQARVLLQNRDDPQRLRVQEVTRSEEWLGSHEIFNSSPVEIKDLLTKMVHEEVDNLTVNVSAYLRRTPYGSSIPYRRTFTWNSRLDN